MPVTVSAVVYVTCQPVLAFGPSVRPEGALRAIACTTYQCAQSNHLSKGPVNRTQFVSVINSFVIVEGLLTFRKDSH